MKLPTDVAAKAPTWELWADLLPVNLESLLQRWEIALREVNGEGLAGDAAARRQHLPHFIDGLATILRHGQHPSHQLSDTSVQQGVAHALHRARVGISNLSIVMLEYRALRSVLLEQLDEVSPLPAPACRRVHEFFDAAIGWAVQEALRLQGLSEKIQKPDQAVETGTAIVLQQQVANLQNERLLRETFVSTLSHDLRTPLGTARLNAQGLLRGAGDGARRDALGRRLLASLDRADDMLRTLLDFKCIEAGQRLPLHIGRCELRPLVRETVRELEEASGDRFVVVIQDGIYGQWDRHALRRIIENLCTNAVKYGDENTLILIYAERHDDGTAWLQVQNQGPIISPDDQVYLFEPFLRPSTAITHVRKGWGLGLTLVRDVAQAHGGHVRVESAVELGTIFTVVLPLNGPSRLDLRACLSLS